MALRDVNLVPPDLMARRLLARHLSVWSCCLVLSLAICLGLYLAGALVISAQHQSLMKRNGEPRFVAMMEEQKRLQNEFTTLDRQKSELRAIEARKQSLAPVLGRLSEIMNGGTWLSQLSMETTEGQRGGTDLVAGRFRHVERQFGRLLEQALRRSLVQGSYPAVLDRFRCRPGAERRTGTGQVSNCLPAE